MPFYKKFFQWLGGFSINEPSSESTSHINLELAENTERELKTLKALNEEFLLQLDESKAVLAGKNMHIAMLEHQNAELERFSYSISHDLKTPLVTITGFLDLLEKDIADGSDGMVARDLMRINDAADTMKSLLDDLLKMAQFGRHETMDTHLSFSDTLAWTEALLHKSIKDKGAQIIVDNTLPQVLIEESRLKEILLNLIENSLKYCGSTQNLEIHIGCSTIKECNDEMWSEFYVQDNGMGIDPRYQKLIFNLFEQLDPQVEGTGVGLALVRRIVLSLGGGIRASSEGEGKGCTIYFDLPLELSSKDKVST